MPTGYTAAIADGISFKEYAMGCARAFGALIEMRDEPSDAQIPEEFKPSTYHLEELQKAKETLRNLTTYSMVEATNQANTAYESAESRRKSQLDKNADLRIKYERMLTEARKYQAPTKEHENFRDFMISQIEESIKFDCSGEYYATPTLRLTGEQWLDQEIKQAKKDIEYHEKAYTEELDNVAQRNDWVKALRESLK